MFSPALNSGPDSGAVVEPPGVRRLSGQEAGVHENASEQEDVVAEAVQSGERQLARTDEKWHEVRS